LESNQQLAREVLVQLPLICLRAQTDQDIEWKFVRSKLYMEYIRQGSPLPVPFNIIPTPHSAVLLITATYRRWRNWQFDRSNQVNETCTAYCADEENSPIYTTRPNGAAGNSTNIPMWQVKSHSIGYRVSFCYHYILQMQ